MDLSGSARGVFGLAGLRWTGGADLGAPSPVNPSAARIASNSQPAKHLTTTATLSPPLRAEAGSCIVVRRAFRHVAAGLGLRFAAGRFQRVQPIVIRMRARDIIIRHFGANQCYYLSYPLSTTPWIRTARRREHRRAVLLLVLQTTQNINNGYQVNVPPVQFLRVPANELTQIF